MVRVEAEIRSLATACARWWGLVPALLLAAIFWLDVSQPSTMVFSMLYVIPIVLTIGMSGARATYIAFLVSSVATVAAAAFGATPLDPAATFANRSLALLAQVLAAAVVIQQLDLRERAAARRTRPAPHADAQALAGVGIDERTLVTAIPEPLILLTMDGCVAEANAAALDLLGLERAQIAHRHWSLLVSQVAPRTIEDAALAVPAGATQWPASGPDVFELEALLRGSHAEPRRCALIAAVVRDAVGAPRGAVVLGRDVTSAATRDAGKDAFIALAAHELRAPLTTLRGYVQLAQSGARSAGIAGLDATMDKTLRQVDRLNQLIGDLLDVSHMQLGRITLQQTTIDAEAFVREIVEQHRVAMPSRVVEVEVALALPAVRADVPRLQQALVNLLDNAIKYSPEDRPIRVALAATGDYLRVSVHDQGIGIPAAEQERIFQRFYRGSSAAHRARGLGVGLYITSEIVQAHGGRMWVRSTEGEGSVFGFDLPSAPV